MKNKTKDELLEIIKDQEETINKLNDDVDYWINEANEFEEQLEKAKEEIDECIYGIKDIDNFIWKLKADNLYSKEIEEFLNYYLRYYND